MAVTNIPNVQNWTVTPQNGQSGYFTLMNTWLGQSTLVIASLQTAITAQNTANSEINALAIQAESSATIAQSIANYQGDWTSKGYTLGQSVSVSGIYYICKLTHATGQNPTTGGSLYWNLALGNWSLKADIKSTNITVNVGAGQTYTTINQALEYLSGFYPLHKTTGVTATINLKAGFVMNEQVLVRGLNLGWITIVGEDAETIITHTALTTALNGTNYPAFGVDRGGTSPRIGQLFRFNVEKVGGNKHGLMTVGAGSSAEVLVGKGFIGAGATGILADGGSTINAQGATASNAGTNGILANQGSTINAQGATASNAGTNGIYANQGSTINAYGATASNAGTNGIYANQGSAVIATTAIIKNQTTGTSRAGVTDGSHIDVSGIDTSGGTVPALSQAANTLTGNGIIYQ